MPELASTSPIANSQPPVVDQIRDWIAVEQLRSGDRLPAERELATKLDVSRGEVRRGIGYLAALGILDVRHGVGAFLAETPSGLGEAPLQFMRTLGTLTTEHLFETRRALEITIAGHAAERCQKEQLVAISEELTEMFATADDPEAFLVHDVRFHRAIAQACGNPILLAMMDSIVGGLFEERRQRAGTLENRQSALLAHRRIYDAVRRHDADLARRAMDEHLTTAKAETSRPKVQKTRRSAQPGSTRRTSTRK
ncbi:transcriptional regulator, GntR family [Bryocella elongata]|uniref:Transcriptional regulator, GntR family n=1 Tax=Bryocella elongata TaxID=863522 RepID=A0A1H6CF87_9BACT|nr:FadR/GntR family transcriptional regulator [Bryocella elongata]SEG71671.1 transcriptional regulator, GntR family [Bryocella elongata]